MTSCYKICLVVEIDHRGCVVSSEGQEVCLDVLFFGMMGNVGVAAVHGLRVYWLFYDVTCAGISFLHVHAYTEMGVWF